MGMIRLLRKPRKTNLTFGLFSWVSKEVNYKSLKGKSQATTDATAGCPYVRTDVAISMQAGVVSSAIRNTAPITAIKNTKANIRYMICLNEKDCSMISPPF